MTCHNPGRVGRKASGLVCSTHPGGAPPPLRPLWQHVVQPPSPCRSGSFRVIFYSRREGAKEKEARDLSAEVSRSLSGLAMWPRLVLDEEATLVVDSRGPLGEHRKSHWQTVLPLLAARPQPVEAGDSIEIRAAVELGGGVAEPPRYSLEGMVRKS